METIEITGGGRIQLDWETPFAEIVLAEQTRDHVSAWYSSMEDIYKRYETYDKSLLVLIDLLQSNITPFFRERIMALRASAQVMRVPTRTAILLQHDQRTEMQVLANMTVMGSSQRLRLFIERTPALEWLHKQKDD